MTNRITVGLDSGRMLAGLDALADEAEAAVRPAAQAGAQVLYDEAKVRVPVGIKGHYFHGKQFKKTGQKYYFSAGSLRAAIYQVYSKDNSGNGRATYHVSWNSAKAPYGHMVESGTSRAPARAFLRPAFDAKGAAAGEAMRAHYEASMARVLGQL